MRLIKISFEGIDDPGHSLMTIQVQLPLFYGFESKRTVFIENLNELQSLLLPLPDDSFYLKCSPEGDIIKVCLRLRGGKGGFGSQLRAQGNKMSSKKRAGNYEACRDLSGQRLRSQKHAKLIAEYLEREPERLSKREQEIEEKMQKHLDAPNKKVMFDDPKYLKTTRKIVDSTEEAVRAALQSDSSEEDSDGSYEEDSSHDTEDSDDSDDSEDEKATLKRKLDKNLSKYM